jgi:ABC-type transport system substrate-binding protein
LEQQRPKALGDRRTREAFYRAIDRQQLADVMIPIAGKEADSWLLPDDSARQTTFRGVIPGYRADRQAALRLLEEVGYRRGPDGSLIDAGTGERFETAVWNTRGGGNERENAIVADHLRGLGMVVDQYIIPASLMDDSEHRASFPGANMTARTVTADFENALFRYRGPTRTSPLGSPRNGYNNPRVIDLVDGLQVTVPEEERLQLQRTIMEAILQELPILPMYWNIETITIRKGVTGPGARTGRYNQYPLTTWNVYEWDVAR